MKVVFLDFDGVITTVKSNWHLDNDRILTKYTTPVGIKY